LLLQRTEHRMQTSAALLGLPRQYSRQAIVVLVSELWTVV